MVGSVKVMTVMNELYIVMCVSTISDRACTLCAAQCPLGLAPFGRAAVVVCHSSLIGSSMYTEECAQSTKHMP